MPSRTLLVVIDPTADAQPALARAAWLAKALRAGLELFVCDYDQHLAAHPLFETKGLEKARRSVLAKHVAALEKLAAPLAAQGLEVAVDAHWGRPLYRGILAKVAATAPALVVKDTHYHAPLKRTLLSNTDWSLIRSCPVPLLLVKPRDVGTAPRILAAVDPLHEHDKPAELDHAILAFAREMAAAVRGELHVLHAYDTAPMLAAASAATPAGVAGVPVHELVAGLEREHRQALQGLLRDVSVEAGNVRLEEGAPHERLEFVAEQIEADFVVMGAVSRSALQRLFVGSTAERALDRLPCDLVVIKPPGFAVPDTE
jgi:universal stress protein E